MDTLAVTGARVLPHQPWRCHQHAIPSSQCNTGFPTVRRCGQVISWTAGSTTSFPNKRWSGLVCNVSSQETSVSSSVAQEVVFTWEGDAKEVLVSADYLKWEAKLPLQRSANGSFSIKQKLAPGRYQIKFIVDGNWNISPSLPTVYDERGILNNEVTVAACQLQATGDVADTRPTETDTKPEPRTPATTASVAPSELSSGSGPAPFFQSPSPPASTSATNPPPAPAPTELQTPPVQSPASAGEIPAAKDKVPATSSPALKQNPEVKLKAQPAAAAQPAPALSSTPPTPAPATSKPSAVAKKAAAKSFPASMSEDVIPALRKALEAEEDVNDIQLLFVDNQLQGNFVKNNVPYSFWALFLDGTWDGSRGFAFASYGNNPSTVEPFLVDEKKITPDLVVFWVKKRLFAQKILSIN